MNSIPRSHALLLFAVIALSILAPALTEWYGHYSSAQKETLALRASNAGCFFGVMAANQDKKAGYADPSYTGEEDMRNIDFSGWKEVSKKDQPAFKRQFQRSLVACYRRYV